MQLVQKPDLYDLLVMPNLYRDILSDQNKVNPTAAMFSGVMLLRYLNELDAAERLERTVAAVIGDAVARNVRMSQKSAA